MYVLPLMQAVFTQYSKAGASLLKKGAACARNIKNEQALPSLILILKSMTLASTQPQCLDIIQQSSTTSEAKSELLDAIVNDIRELMDVVMSDSGLILQLRSLDESVVEKYIEEHVGEQDDPTIAMFFQDSDQADKCYQLMAGIEHNVEFFQHYLHGFAAIRQRINGDGVETAKTLSEIIERIEKIELENPPQWKEIRVFEKEMSPLSFFVTVSLYFMFG